MASIDWYRIGRVVRYSLEGMLAVAFIVLLPDLYMLLPRSVRYYAIEVLAVICLAAVPFLDELAARGPGKLGIADRAGAALAGIDRFVEWMLGRGLAISLAAIVSILILAWMPHYLTWPASRDQETFAVIAQSWEHGILPYRDIRAYNFPGATYMAWGLAKVFGWGHTVPLLALDSAFLLTLGVVLISWSRKRLGGVVPGLFGYLNFLCYYMTSSFEGVAERDWHTGLFVCLGLMGLQLTGGRGARVASAALAAAALSIRPHAVLFFPALFAAVIDADREPAASRANRIRAACEWCLSLCVFSAILFAPLFLEGIADDLIRGLKVASYGGPYHNTTVYSSFVQFLTQFTHWKITIPLVATLALAANPGSPFCRTARPWAIAFAAALVYRPIHPVHHGYLLLPLLLVASIAWAFPVSWLLSSERTVTRASKVVLLVLLMYEIMPVPPAMCELSRLGPALRSLAMRTPPNRVPIGAIKAFPQAGLRSPNWLRYCRILDYLRHETSPDTYVANVLNRFPYESLNGPTGRLSPFLAESGICWMALVDFDLDPEFAEQLKRTPNSVVVWEPDQERAESRMRLTRVVEVIREYYEPAKSFGTIEVWKRKPETDVRPGNPPQ
jgi:hypothetical protein